MPSAPLPEKFRRLGSWVAHRMRAARGGHGIHSPFVYSLCEEVFYNRAGFYEFNALEIIREDLLKDSSLIEVRDMGAGSQYARDQKRKVKEISSQGISTAHQSQQLFKLINFLKAGTCIELGTSLGLNTLYMAMANKNGRVYSLEGSLSLLQFAKNLAEKNKVNTIHFVEGHFDFSLPAVLEKIQSFDLAYVDGNHTMESTLHYFDLLLKKSHANSLIVFDDINWSSGMQAAWKKIESHPAVRLSIDTYYQGLVFFREEIKEKQKFRLWV